MNENKSFFNGSFHSFYRCSKVPRVVIRSFRPAMVNRSWSKQLDNNNSSKMVKPNSHSNPNNNSNKRYRSLTVQMELCPSSKFFQFRYEKSIAV